MATVIRSAKSGSDWTTNELQAYNIDVQLEDVATFFGVAQLPPTTISQVILSHANLPALGLPNKADRIFFALLDDAMAIAPGEESAVDDFAAHLLSMLDYDAPGRHIRQHKDIPFFICGIASHAKTDVCVVNDAQGIILLVQEDKRYLERVDPEAQLIAEAIATFQDHNNRLRRAGLPTLQSRVVPGISMVGTAPTFYKVDVTVDLVRAIELGQYPAQVTTVHRFVPPVPRPLAMQQEGMRPLDNRRIMIQCFEALKQFVN
ncbi:hypothetical protein BJV78DRAFT_1151243 [Lactifluus subvellereus]|nr:hypothetical protein BJV78DRAFT_1151243 [Lactifluus subvellereus]